MFNNRFNRSVPLIIPCSLNLTSSRVMEDIWFLQVPSDTFCILPLAHLRRAQIWARGTAAQDSLIQVKRDSAANSSICSARAENGAFFLPAFGSVLLKDEDLRTCMAAFRPDCMQAATGHCVFQACTIIAISLVTVRNLIITSALSSAGMKVPSWLRGNIVVMIVVLPRYAQALQAAMKPLLLPFPDAFCEYFYGFLQKYGRRGRW